MEPKREFAIVGTEHPGLGILAVVVGCIPVHSESPEFGYSIKKFREACELFRDSGGELDAVLAIKLDNPLDEEKLPPPQVPFQRLAEGFFPDEHGEMRAYRDCADGLGLTTVVLECCRNEHIASGEDVFGRRTHYFLAVVRTAASEPRHLTEHLKQLIYSEPIPKPV